MTEGLQQGFSFWDIRRRQVQECGNCQTPEEAALQDTPGRMDFCMFPLGWVLSLECVPSRLAGSPGNRSMDWNFKLRRKEGILGFCLKMSKRSTVWHYRPVEFTANTGIAAWEYFCTSLRDEARHLVPSGVWGVGQRKRIKLWPNCQKKGTWCLSKLQANRKWSNCSSTKTFGR